MSERSKSSAYLSEFSQTSNQSDEESLTNLQYNTLIIRNIGILIAFLILILSLFFSWSAARSLVFKSIYVLGYCKVLTIASLQRRKIGNLMSNFEILSGFSSQMSQPLQHIQCNKEDISNFIKYCKTVHQYSINPVSIFHLIYPNFTSCRIEINRFDSSKFNLLYFTRFNDSTLSSYRYNENTDFDNWDSESSFYRYFPSSFFDFLNNTPSNLLWVNEADFHGSSEWNKLLTIYSINRQNDTIKNIFSVCLNVQHLFNTINVSDTVFQSHFALLRKDSQSTIFTSDLGTLSPLGFQPGTYVPIFPQLSELNNTFWRLVSAALADKSYNMAALINTTDDKWKDIMKQGKDFEDELDGSLYIAIRTKISSLSDSRFDIITAIKLDETITNYFFAPTVVFVGLLVFLALIYVVSRIILNYTISKLPNDISEATDDIINTSDNFILRSNENLSSLDYDTSSIFKAVNGIRNYQISFPDDINLNKLLDEIVTELTQPKERLFSVSVSKDCKFCSLFVKHNSNFSRKNYPSNQIFDSLQMSSSSSYQKSSKNKKNDKSNEEQTYGIWKMLSKQNLIKIGSNPDIQIIKKDPIKSFIYAYLDVIQRFNLTLPEFDPDLLTQFIIEFSSKCVSIHFYTIFLAFHLTKLLSGPFNNWLLQKIDLFILFFVTFTNDIDMTKIVETFPNQNSDEGSLISQEYLIFNDKYSETERKLEYIFSIFYKFFPRLKNNYFEENVRDIFFGIQDFNRNELFSTFHCRIQSPNFNVHNDIFDKRLFIKSIISLCLQWPYFSSEELMVKVLKSLSSKFFYNLDISNNPNFIPSFHYNYTEFFVKPWVELFDQFSPLTELKNNVENTLLYWKQIVEKATNFEVEY